MANKKLPLKEIFQITGRLLALTERRGEINQNGEIPPADRERRKHPIIL